MPELTCTAVKADTENYTVAIKRPNGSLVYVLIPREDADTYEAKSTAAADKHKPYGLNLVYDGHHT